jgi:hypothetical protein
VSGIVRGSNKVDFGRGRGEVVGSVRVEVVINLSRKVMALDGNIQIRG